MAIAANSNVSSGASNDGGIALAEGTKNGEMREATFETASWLCKHWMGGAVTRAALP